MPVNTQQLSDGDIRAYEICPEIGTPYKLMTLQVGRYANAKDHFIAVMPQDVGLDGQLLNIFNEIQETGLVEQITTRDEVEVDFSLPQSERHTISRLQEIEMLSGGGRIAPFNQMDCFRQLLDKLAYHELCSREDALHVYEMEVNCRGKVRGWSR